eukprot:3769633-Amphidinium_carterae.1
MVTICILTHLQGGVHGWNLHLGRGDGRFQGSCSYKKTSKVACISFVPKGTLGTENPNTRTGTAYLTKWERTPFHLQEC